MAITSQDCGDLGILNGAWASGHCLALEYLEMWTRDEGKGDPQPVCENHQGYSDLQGRSVEGACDTLRRLDSFISSQRLQKFNSLEASGSTIHPVHSSIFP